MTWQKRAAPLINQVLRDTAGLTPRERRAHLRTAYPWPPRRGHPYDAWLQETKRQWPGFTRRAPEPAELELAP